MRGIQVREELTDEWKQRNVGGDQEYAILTAEISKATFGLTPTEYKKHKELKQENLRDHMTDLELIFSMLKEKHPLPKLPAIKKNAQGFDENRTAAKQGGAVAGSAKKDLETKTGKKVVTKQNYLPEVKKVIKGKIKLES